MKFRHELKYLINYPDYELIKMRISELLDRDEHVGKDERYTVRSLYFDDYFNTAYNEKNMGVLNRQKYRIRLYNHSDSVIKLERKIKSDKYIYKQVSPLSRDDVRKIIRGNFSFLLYSPHNNHRVFYHQCVSKMMRPRVMVDYEREPYVLEAGTIRITFDTNVRAGVGPLDIFDKKMAMLEVLEAGKLIMEVKFTEFLPDLIRRILPTESREFTAVSKYVLCCDKTLYKRKSNY